MRITAFIFILLTIALALLSIRMTPETLHVVLPRLAVWLGCPFAAGFFLDRYRRR